MKRKYFIYQIIFILSFVFSESFFNEIKSAEKVTLVNGIIGRSISIKDLKAFANDGIKNDLLKRTIKEDDEQKIIMIIQKEYKAPIVLTSKLLYSNIGNILINRIAKVIYPLRVNDNKTKSLAIKAATIKALAENGEKISILTFLEAYPSKIVVININELNKIINKVESMSELVEFYSDSPLEKLK